MIFIPHRATSIVDKTTRTMLQFIAAVKADNIEVKETLGIKDWKEALVNKGDIALKTSDQREPVRVRGIGVGRTDNENMEIIKSAAKIFYKMGVEIPDWSHLKVCHNINIDEVKLELYGPDHSEVQFDETMDLKAGDI